ncbi:MAG: primosomal protein N' [Anaerolineales bacterium]|nr:primosomal protein N' [Anaerolineales bacterium]
MFARIAINLPAIQSAFDYAIPDHLVGKVHAGSLVTAPFGSRSVQGIVLELIEEPAVPETRFIHTLIDQQPVINQAQLQLAYWLETQTRAPLIECLALMLPPGLSKQADSLYTLQEENYQPEPGVETRLIRLLQRRGPLRGRQLQRALQRRNWKTVAESLLRREILARSSVLSPPSVRPLKIRSARLACTPEQARQITADIGRHGSEAHQRRIAMIDSLIREGEPLSVTWLYAESGGSMSDLRILEDQGLVLLSESEIWRDPLESLDFVPTTAPVLTADQQKVWLLLEKAQRDGTSPRIFLLHGVTGSGKTEIYLAAVAEALRQGKQAVVMVPEISLTPQTVRRFVSRFPGQVGLMHSKLSPGERYDTWRRVRDGQLPIIIGPRSALFAPLSNPGVLILDESHDDSYKEQSRAVRYHTRTAAAELASIHQCICIFGSATPDITTRYLAEQGQLQLLQLPNRILGHRQRIKTQSERLHITPVYRAYDHEAEAAELPPVEIVDMRAELKAGNRSYFSRSLQHALKDTLDAGHQAILFLNRRGGATYIFCRDCGSTLTCPRCGTALNQHLDQNNLRCHHCSYQRKMPSLCPECGSSRFKAFGAGTQRIENTLHDLFPVVRTLRWDRDTTGSRGAHDIILSHFAAHRADILIGTQMIAKGLDLPLVTLVGIVHADMGLNLPDFRSAERTFQILTQVAGRAGRSLLGGKVILQTYQPEHFVIRAAANHDYGAFYAFELQQRKSLRYPPFTRLARLIYQHNSDCSAEDEAKRMASMLRKQENFPADTTTLIGPAPCFYHQLNGLYRWQIIVRTPHPLQLLPDTLPEGWSLDVDPVSLL